MNELIIYGIIAGVILLFFISGIRIIRPNEKGLVERMGKYHRFANPGFNWIIPMFDSMVFVNISEMMADAKSQEIITKDKLNAMVGAQIYYKVKPDEANVKNSMYNVFDYETQIISLTRTTLRNVIGTLTLNQANSERNRINKQLMDTLSKETKNWGIEVVRAELTEINPPQRVQETMNSVVIAENEKQSAIDFATAAETKADGMRRAKIKEAEGLKQFAILEAEGKAKAFEMINKSFIGNAQLLKKMEVTENSLKDNAKIILTKEGINPQIILGEIPMKASR